MKKRTAALAASVSIIAISLTGCGSPTWQEALRESMEAEVSAEDLDMACAGLALFGLDTPEEIGTFVLGFDDEDELPPGSTTMEEFAEQQGQDLDDLPFKIDPDVTVRDITNEVGAWMLEECDI